MAERGAHCRTQASDGCGGAPTASCCAVTVRQWVYAGAPQTRGSDDLKRRLAAFAPIEFRSGDRQRRCLKRRSRFSNDMRRREDLGASRRRRSGVPMERRRSSFSAASALLPRHFQFNTIRCAAPSNTATGPDMLYTGDGRSALYSNLSCFAAVRLPSRDRPSSATFGSCD